MPSRETTSITYELCPRCADGSCKQCGPASSEHAAPGVVVVVRRVRFVPCSCKGKGCERCGPGVHELAAVGVCLETVDEHASKRWVPSLHMKIDGKPRCGAPGAEDRMTDDRTAVTCTRCQRFIKGKKLKP